MPEMTVRSQQRILLFFKYVHLIYYTLYKYNRYKSDQSVYIVYNTRKLYPQ